MSSPRDHIENTRRRDKITQKREEYTGYDNDVDRYAYKYFGDLFSDKEEFLSDYQDTLKAAHIQYGSDLYLARLIVYAIVIFVTFFILGSITSVTSWYFGVVSIFLDMPIVATLIYLLTPFIMSILPTIIFAGIYYIRPSYIANRRKSAINAILPSAITFMYALNRGGMNLVEVIRTIAENEEIYGEFSNEAGTIIQDMEFFSRDLLEALHRAGERSPSSKFSDFMDDTVATIDSGASTVPFLRDQSNKFIEDAEKEQENFIETLSLLGEVYVTAFVAGPLFMIIITVIMAMMGGANPTQLDGIVYGLLPFMNIMYYYLIDIISGADPKKAETMDVGDTINRKSEVDIDTFAENTNDKRVTKVYEAKQKRERTALLRQPITELLNNPNLTAIFTSPLALTYIAFAVIFGLAIPSFGAFIDAPVIQTFHWLLIPTFIVAVPLSITFEISNRRKNSMMSRLPEALKQLASANSVGMTLTEALETTADNTSGILGEELHSVKNDIQWNYDVNTALKKFSNRLRIPLLTRTVKLITEANESTGNIEEVISIAAKNVQTQVRLKKERKQALFMYTAVILISFAVYMFVIAILDIMFLSTIGELDGGSLGGDAAGGGGSSGGGGGGGGFEISSLPVDRFRVVFYHSTIIQAFGSGLIAGYLASEDVRSGLKFAIILSIISSGLFFFL